MTLYGGFGDHKSEFNTMQSHGDPCGDPAYGFKASSYGYPADHESKFNTICAGHTPGLPSTSLLGEKYGTEPESVAYPGHPAFSHNSMPMSILNSGFDTLPVANKFANLDRLGFVDSDGYCSPPIDEFSSSESASSPAHEPALQATTSVTPGLAASPNYSRSPTVSELSTLPDYKSELSTSLGQSTIGCQEARPMQAEAQTAQIQIPASDHHAGDCPIDHHPKGDSPTIIDLTGSPTIIDLTGSPTASPQHWGNRHFGSERRQVPISDHHIRDHHPSHYHTGDYRMGDFPTGDHPVGGHPSDDYPLDNDLMGGGLTGSLHASRQDWPRWLGQDHFRDRMNSQPGRGFSSDNSPTGYVEAGFTGRWANTEDWGFVNPHGGNHVEPGPTVTENLLAKFDNTYGLPQSTHHWNPAPMSAFQPVKRSSAQKYRANLETTRYEDGEVLRYGAGESYRPFNRDNRDNRERERSPPPRRARSPLRDRDLRARTPPVASDSYVPNRSPRRRSRSPDRYRAPDRARDSGGESWRRRDSSRGRARSPLPAVRRVSPRRSPRRSPNRYSPAPRRDDRFDRARSPRRDFDNRDRRRSRSPFDRDRRDRPRSPIRRSPPPPRVGASYRPRSRSPDRRDDRYGPGPNFRRPSPILKHESAVNSARTSPRSNSRSRNVSPRAAPSPRPISRGYDSRSRQHSPIPHSPAGLSDANAIPVRNATPRNQTPLRSPPRGPAALRAPPTGPSATRNFTAPSTTLAASRYPTTPAGPHSRADVTSPTIPPSGPRGYVPPPRSGGFGSRGGRGGGGNWSTNTSRFAPPPQSPVTPHHSTGNANAVPTGPRASISQPTPSPSTASRPFNPPTGPASQGSGHGNHQRPTLAQNLIANMPPVLPQGRIDPLSMPLRTGVTKDLEAHHQRLKEEEERIRADLRAKDAKLRNALRVWERLDRESRAYELKSELSDQSLKTIAGEGVGGAAF